MPLTVDLLVVNHYPETEIPKYDFPKVEIPIPISLMAFCGKSQKLKSIH